jgi:hypothetical protein
LVDVQGILRAVLAPMPSVRWGSLNKLHHNILHCVLTFQNDIMSALIFLSFPVGHLNFNYDYCNSISVFSLHKQFHETSLIPVSFPDVKGTLAPTVTAGFVDAVPTLWQVKISALTHKTFSTDNRFRAGFLPFYTITYNKIITSKWIQRRDSTTIYFKAILNPDKRLPYSSVILPSVGQKLS